MTTQKSYFDQQISLVDPDFVAVAVRAIGGDKDKFALSWAIHEVCHIPFYNDIYKKSLTGAGNANFQMKKM